MYVLKIIINTEGGISAAIDPHDTMILSGDHLCGSPLSGSLGVDHPVWIPLGVDHPMWIPLGVVNPD